MPRRNTPADLERVAREMGKLIDDINYGPVRECRGEAKDPIQKWDEALSQLKAPTFLNVERMEDPERKSGAAVDRRERALPGEVEEELCAVLRKIQAEYAANENLDLRVAELKLELERLKQVARKTIAFFGRNHSDVQDLIRAVESSGGGEKP